MKKNILISIAIMLTWQFAFSQCFPQRHSTNYFDGWISCNAAPNPNPARPAGHFIMYDYKKVFALGETTIWNTNDPSHLDWGMRDVAIDYSTDGINWEHAGEFIFPQASGLSTYEGVSGPYLENIEARYLLITALSNYGGECFGLSEIKINAEEVIISDVETPETLTCMDVVVYPNPFAEKITINIKSACTGDFQYRLMNALGREILVEKINVNSGQSLNIEIGRDLPSGTYMLSLESGGRSIQKSIVKI